MQASQSVKVFRDNFECILRFEWNLYVVPLGGGEDLFYLPRCFVM